MKVNSKLVYNYITEENVNFHFKYAFIPKKIESHLTNFIVHDPETHNTVRARPYCLSFYSLSKLAGRYNLDFPPYELKNCKNDTFVFDGDDCVTIALIFLVKLKGEELKVENKVVEYNLQLHAHNGSGFDTWIVSNNLPCDKHIVDNIKNGNGIVSLGVFDGYIQRVKDKLLNI